MPGARPIRDDIPAEELRRLARRERNGRVASRLLGLALALKGIDRGEAVRLAGMDPQTLRDWVIWFNAEGVAGLRDRPKSGRPTWLDEGQLASLRAVVLRGPDPESGGVSVDRAGWHIATELAVPANLTPVFLPAYAPELNAIERVWLYLRERFPSHRLWPSCDAILDACCAAWSALLEETGPHPLLVFPRLGHTAQFLMRSV